MILPQAKPPAPFRKHVLALLGESYGDKTLILCPTAFVKLLNGDHKAAILLAQILYWADRTKDAQGWFYKSYADWQLETGLSEAQVRRIVNGDPRVKSAQVTLRALGVETVLRKVKRTGAPTLHYRVNRAQLLSVLNTFMGQGDSPNCPESIPDKAEDEPPAMSGINAEQSAPSSDLDSKTKSPEESSEDHDHQDEDSDLAFFFSFEDRFGKLKEGFHETFRGELNRLGATRVKEVLDRCAMRGRSFSYVAKALANETTAAAPQENGAETRWAGPLACNSDDGWVQPPVAEEAPLPVSERLATPWHGFGAADGTVQDAWSAAFHQLELQLDRGSFERWLRDAALVDFEPETHTFVVVARNQFACDLLQGRLDRMIRRLLSDIYGQAAQAQFLLREQWTEPGAINAQSA